MLEIKLPDRKLLGIDRIAGVQAGAQLLIDKVSVEKAGEPRGHVGVPRHDDEPKRDQTARAENRAQPRTPARNEKGGHQNRAERPERAVQPLAHGAERQKNPESEIPAGIRVRRRLRTPRLNQAPESQRNKGGEKRLRLHEMVENPDAQHRGQDQRGRDAETFPAQSPRDEIGRDDPAHRRQGVRQAQREFVFAQDGGGNEHCPVNERRLLHAREAIAHRHQPVTPLMHLPHRPGIEPFVIVENHRRETGADIEEGDEAEN